MRRSGSTPIIRLSEQPLSREPRSVLLTKPDLTAVTTCSRQRSDDAS